jgi:peptidoglycan/LPS O-acetylase OafA/YrhL
MTAPTHTYRADIDGLRAIAVLSVVIYHAVPAALPGGFAGVDVFFVISGFLISGILQDALARGRFSLAEFYARRIRRIFPALALVLAAVLLYGLVVLLPGERALLGRDAAGGAFFVANLVFWAEVGYFDREAAAKPLLHLWSLGVEEQFYLLWPLVLWGLHRWSGVRLWPILALAGVSLAASLVLTPLDPSAAFYSPFTRLWELALGAALAWWVRARQGALARADAVSVAGLGLIVLSLAVLRAGAGFPGWQALLPTAGAALLIAAGPGGWVNRRVLALRPMVWVGLISYPLYLWHWPLLSYAHIVHQGRPLKPLLLAALVGAAVALSWATWRFLETPIRTGRWPRPVPGLAGGMVLAGLAGLVLWRLPAPDPALAAGLDIARLNAAIGDGVFRPTPAMAVQEVGGKFSTLLGPAEGPGVLLVGDSTLFHYGPRAQALHEAGRLAGPVRFVVGPSCAPFPGTVMPPPFTHCTALPAMVEAALAEGRIGTVVLGAFWPGYLQPRVQVQTPSGLVPAPTAPDAVFAHLEAEVARLRAKGLRVVLLLPSPAHPRFDPRRMVARSWRGATVAADATAPIPLAELAPPHADRLRAIAARHGAELRDPLPAICGPASTCPPLHDGAPKFADDKHLRPGFAAGLTFLDDLLAR